VAPVDSACSIHETDYFKKDMALFLFAFYGIATELRYIGYFLACLFYMMNSSAKVERKDKQVLVLQLERAPLMMI
jgi:hypothetical protein